MVAGKGFIGGAVGERLGKDHEVKYLDRSNGYYQRDATESFEIEEEFDVLIHTIGLAPGFASEENYNQVHVEGTENLINGVKCDKIIYLSALGVGKVDHSFFETKEKAEELIKDSGKDYTIIRPSTVYGPGNKLLELIRKFAPTRVFPNLPTETQPILRKDLMEMISKTVEEFNDRTLNAAGPEKFSLGEMARRIYKEEGYRCLLVPFPLFLLKLHLYLLNFLGPPFMKENIEIVKSSNSTEDNDAENIVELSRVFDF